MGRTLTRILNSQPKGSRSSGAFGLSVLTGGIVSPYYRNSVTDRPGRDINLSLNIMAKKILAEYSYGANPSQDFTNLLTLIYETTTGVIEVNQDSQVSLVGVANEDQYRAAAVTGLLATAVGNGYNTLTSADIVWLTDGTSARSFANPSRTLNSAFQISTTRDAQVSYSVDIATSVSLSGGAVGTVFLEYADDSGFTTNVKEVGRMVNGNTGTLVVGLVLNQTATATVSGIIPAGKYTRIRTANTTGTPTFTFRSSQEVLI